MPESVTENLYDVRGYEITPVYRLKKSALIQLMFECFAYECEEKGLTGYELEEENRSWILSEWYIEYKREMPRWKEQIRVETWLRQMSGLRFLRDFRAWHGSDLIACASSSWLVIDKTSRRPLRAEILADKYTLLPESALEGFSFPKIQPIGEPYSISKTTVRPSDIDFNRHLNSIHYIVESMNSIPFEYRDHHPLFSVQVKYMQEVFLGDRILTETYRNGHEFFHTQSRKSDGKEVCRILTNWRPLERKGD